MSDDSRKTTATVNGHQVQLRVWPLLNGVELETPLEHMMVSPQEAAQLARAILSLPVVQEVEKAQAHQEVVDGIQKLIADSDIAASEPSADGA